MRRCIHCSSELAEEFRFCPACGAAQRSKIVEYFRGHRDFDEGDLRVSAYLTSPRHLRFSLWRHDRAVAAISLDTDEAHRLGRFLLGVAPQRDEPRIGRSIRRSARALREAVTGSR